MATARINLTVDETAKEEAVEFQLQAPKRKLPMICLKKNLWVEFSLQLITERFKS